jgi:hypothetical protein
MPRRLSSRNCRRLRPESRGIGAAIECSALTRMDRHLASRSTGVESSVEANNERLHALPEPKLQIMNVRARGERE